jgi:riboflavin transporter FmnP
MARDTLGLGSAMYRVSLAAMFGAVLLLVPYLEFRALPGHQGEDFDLAAAIPDLLAFLSGGEAFPAGAALLLATAKFIVVLLLT